MIKTLVNGIQSGRIMASRNTQKALERRGLVRLQNLYTGESPIPWTHGYWLTVEAFELLDDMGFMKSQSKAAQS